MVATTVAAAGVETKPIFILDLLDGEARVEALFTIGVMVSGGVGGAGAEVAARSAGRVLGAKGEAAVALGQADLFLPGGGEDLGATHMGDRLGQSGENGAVRVVDTKGNGARLDVLVALVRVHGPVGLLNKVNVGKGGVRVAD